jgi:ATP-dependent Clp protease ATP-binding subunit ClpA
VVACYLSAQAGATVRRALDLARGRGHGWLGTEHLLVAILERWDDPGYGGGALLRASGLIGAQVPELVNQLLRRGSADDAGADASAGAAADPRPSPAARLALAQAFRVAAEARDAYVGTEHLVVALLWQDAAGELRQRGVSYEEVTGRLPGLPRVEQAVADETIEPLEAVAVPTPAAAVLAELARQRAGQHPVGGDGRIGTLHYLLALWAGGGAARRVLADLGVTYQSIVERLHAAGADLRGLDDHRDELPIDGWASFEVGEADFDLARGQMGAVLEELAPRGVRFGMQAQGERFLVAIHPGRSGLEPRAILGRLVGRGP